MASHHLTSASTVTLVDFTAGAPTLLLIIRCLLTRTDTSKFPPRADLHGKYGVFLASVGSLSLLTISSHHHMHNSHNSLTLHNSQVLSRHIPALAEHRIVTFPHGTRVTVSDLFGSMPVRVKQRIIESDKLAHRDWDYLVRTVAALLVAWPSPVLLSMRNIVSGQSLTVRTAEDHTHLALRTASLLSQASLSHDADIKSWVPLSASASGISATGCISLNPCPTKQVQFISIGVEPLIDEYRTNVLYEEINGLFSNSAFGAVEDDEESIRNDAKQASIDSKRRYVGLKKGLDRWPMFSVQIHLGSRFSHTDVMNFLEDRQNVLETLFDIIRAMFHGFLKKYHFRPRICGRDGAQISPTCVVADADKAAFPTSCGAPPRSHTKKQSLRTSEASRRNSPALDSDQSIIRPPSPFSQWKRIKAGRETNRTARHISQGSQLPAQDATKSNSLDVPAPATQSLIGSDGRLLRRPFAEKTVATEQIEVPSLSPSEHLETGPTEDDGVVIWQNPASKRSVAVDSRTGFVIRCKSGARSTKEPIMTPGRTVVSSESSEPAVTNASKPWIQSLLLSWRNPVFEAAEPPIPRLHDMTDPLAFDSTRASAGIQERVSKEGLQAAEVIAQVDQKFILIKVRSSPSTTNIAPESQTSNSRSPDLLILVDQHAADERCRLEQLMAGYFQSINDGGDNVPHAHTIPLDKAIHFDLSTSEHNLLRLYQKHFEHWGIFYETDSHLPSTRIASRASVPTVRVVGLPPSIAERCRLEPKLVADLIRKEIWSLAESEQPLPRADGSVLSSNSTHPWVSQFHGCPQGILDLLNSRSCRSK
jgi:DNA mismatch repair protein MLH3